MHVSPEQLAVTSQWMERWGKYGLLICYFIPGVRHVAALVLGASRLSPSIFARYALALCFGREHLLVWAI